MELFERYHHDPIGADRIRLLTLLPNSSPSATVQCEIMSVLVSDRPSYEAVSYRWGPSEENGNYQSVTVDGKPFPVRRNLYSLLSCLRGIHSTRTLWIDALCIDQENLKEKTEQVSSMGRIYEQAGSVVVFLDKALGYNPDVKDLRIVLDGRRRTSYDPEDIVAMAAIFEHPYWRRTWILQEFLHARQIRIYHGRQELSWGGFEEIPQYLRQAGYTNQFSDSVPLKLMKQRGHLDRVHLSELLRTSVDTQCEDPRDKVFALLSLAKPNKRGQNMKAKYQSDIIQVFDDVLKFCDNVEPESRFAFAALLSHALRGPYPKHLYKRIERAADFNSRSLSALFTSGRMGSWIPLYTKAIGRIVINVEMTPLQYRSLDAAFYTFSIKDEVLETESLAWNREGRELLGKMQKLMGISNESIVSRLSKHRFHLNAVSNLTHPLSKSSTAYSALLAKPKVSFEYGLQARVAVVQTTTQALTVNLVCSDALSEDLICCLESGDAKMPDLYYVFRRKEIKRTVGHCSSIRTRFRIIGRAFMMNEHIPSEYDDPQRPPFLSDEGIPGQVRSGTLARLVTQAESEASKDFALVKREDHSRDYSIEAQQAIFEKSCGNPSQLRAR